MNHRTLLPFALFAALAVGCAEEGSAEKAGSAIDDAIADVKDAGEDLADDAEKALEDAAEAIEEKTDGDG